MALTKYEKVKKLILENPDKFDFDEGCSLESLLLAEKELNLTFSEDYRNFLPDYLMIIGDGGLGDYLCLNYRMLNEYGVPKETTYYPRYSDDVQTHEVIADSFASYLAIIANQRLKKNNVISPDTFE